MHFWFCLNGHWILTKITNYTFCNFNFRLADVLSHKLRYIFNVTAGGSSTPSTLSQRHVGTILEKEIFSKLCNSFSILLREFRKKSETSVFHFDKISQQKENNLIVWIFFHFLGSKITKKKVFSEKVSHIFSVLPCFRLFGSLFSKSEYHLKFLQFSIK